MSKVRKLFTRPCEEMVIVSYIQKQEGRKREESPTKQGQDFVSYLDFEFTQGSEKLQVILNERDFGVESCWSGIGGFVGIFVGYSLMQLPELLVGYFPWITRRSFPKSLILCR